MSTKGGKKAATPAMPDLDTVAEEWALRKRWLCGCAGAPAQSRCIEVIALAEKRIGEELERGRAELLFGDR